MCFIIISIIVIVFIVVLAQTPKKYNDLGKRYHCPSILPYFGNLYHFLGDKGILPIVESWVTIAGENIFIYLSKKPYIIVNNLQMIEFVLKSKKFVARPTEYKYLSDVFGSGLPIKKGEEWKDYQTILKPTFHHKNLKQFIKIFDNHTKTFIRNLEDDVGEDSIDISESASLCVLDIICETTFGFNVEAQDDPTSEIVSCFQKLSEILYYKCFTSYRFEWIYYVSTNYQDERRMVDVIKNFSKSAIRSIKEQRAKKKYSVLDTLINSRVDGNPYPENDIRDELNNIVFAGHNTTSSALCFTLYLLSKHQSVQDKVVSELQSIYGFNKTAPTSLEKLNEMKYLEQVIKESLRLYPPISVYARLITEDVKFDGVVIPKGVSTVILPYVMHRDPIIYNDPKKFDPERFTPENEKKRHPYAYLSFSGGPRKCIGQNFVMLELKTIISKVILHYEILPAVPNHVVEPMIRLTLQSANGINIRLKKRKLKL